MAEIKKLEYKYSKDYQTAFEDLATLMFCTELGLSHGVNRRINQRGIESDPVVIGSKTYAYQAKYYEPSTTLSSHKSDLIKSIDVARAKGVTDLMFFINKNLPDTNYKTDEEVKFIKEIQDAANGAPGESSITLDWWTLSKIETSLDKPDFRYINDLYFGDFNEGDDYSAFYEYIYKAFSEIPKNSLYGAMSLYDNYIESTILINDSEQNVRDYLETWVTGEKTISVISGEPGHGKTSLCRKAMCDFYKKGWLSGKVSNVFCFSLNPAMTNALADDTFTLDDLLSWGRNRKDPDHIIKSKYCKDALIFFDGFDELLEWHPKFDFKSFIENEIVPFQEETGAHIIVTSRNMAVTTYSKSYDLDNGEKIPIGRLQLITKTQQIDWIQHYINHCRENLPDKAQLLEKYLIKYQTIIDDNNLKDILGIPSIFRMIVNAEYVPEGKQTITKIYDELFHATWKRHKKKSGTDKDEQLTKKELQHHALHIFIDDNDTAIADISKNSSWLFSFYTTHDGKERVGFLHRSFYQYFLANEVFSWYKKYSDDMDIIKFKDILSYLVRRKLDQTTLLYIAHLYYQESDKNKKGIKTSIEKTYELLKETDGFFPLPDNKADAEHIKTVIQIKRANNIFWNIISIGSLCGCEINKGNINLEALRLYDLSESVLLGVNIENKDLSDIPIGPLSQHFINILLEQIKGPDLHGVDLDRAYLNNAKLCAVNMSIADLRYAVLRDALLVGANLANAHLDNSNFTGANLRYAVLKNAELENAVLSNADLSNADFTDANLSNAKLTGANLSNADLTDANLSDADLTGANLQDAVLDRAIFNRSYSEKCDSRRT